jgi:hypothetical protein
MSETSTEVLDQYVAFWNAETGDQQRGIAEAIFATPISYHAPIGVLTGPEQLINFRNQFVGEVGDAALVLRRTPETHHDRARLLWEIQLAGGESFATGTDMIVFGPDGRIGSVTSFLDRAPAGFDARQHE